MKQKPKDCLQVIGDAEVIYEIDKSIRHLYGNKFQAINRIPYVEPTQETEILTERIEVKKRKSPVSAGSGRLQAIIREALALNRHTQAELSVFARENHLSSGNVRAALERMRKRGEVRRAGKFWMRTQHGS